MPNAINLLQVLWLSIGVFGLILFWRHWRRANADVRYWRRLGTDRFRRAFVLGNRRRATALLCLQIGFIVLGFVPTLPREWRGLSFTLLLLYAALILLAIAVGEERSYAWMEETITQKEHESGVHTVIPQDKREEP